LFHEAKDTMPLEIAENYALQLQDAQAWYSGVHITAHRYVSATALERALEGKCATPKWWFGKWHALTLSISFCSLLQRW